jgi:protein-S-isoprenylcysteine O-methyltransferase Ste14
MIQRLRVPLGFVIAGVVLYLAKPSGVSILLGLPVALIGAIFRALAASVIRKDASLATHGPYAWTRNPLYFGSFLIGAGFAIMSGSWIAAALIVLPSFVIYPTVIKREEAHLARLFPQEFRDYSTRVPRFFPRLGAVQGELSFGRYWSNREYNTALGFAAVLAVFVAKWRLL